MVSLNFSQRNGGNSNFREDPEAVESVKVKGREKLGPFENKRIEQKLRERKNWEPLRESRRKGVSRRKTLPKKEPLDREPCADARVRQASGAPMVRNMSGAFRGRVRRH